MDSFLTHNDIEIQLLNKGVFELSFSDVFTMNIFLENGKG